MIALEQQRGSLCWAEEHGWLCQGLEPQCESENATLECTSCLQSGCESDPGFWKGQAQACSKQGATQRHSPGSAMVKYVVNGEALGDSAGVSKSPELTPDDITSCLSISGKPSKGFNFLIRKIKHIWSKLSLLKQAEIKGACSGGSLCNEAGCCRPAAACASAPMCAPFHADLGICDVASAIFWAINCHGNYPWLVNSSVESQFQRQQ